jgi:hypothetical protein
MKTKFIVTISPEEEEILAGASGILREICTTFNGNNQCEMCPMRSICDILGYAPHIELYHIVDALTVEEEE